MSSTHRRVIHSKATAAISIVINGICLHLACPIHGQSLTTAVADSVPMGLRSILPDSGLLELGPMEGFKGGFAYGVGVKSTYDSNFFLEENHPQSELTTLITPWITYYSDPLGGAPISLTATYRPTQRIYMNNPSLNGFDQSGDITLKIEGAKIKISAYANYSSFSGTDSLTGTYVNGSLLETGISGSYQIAPRTSLFANLRYAMSDYGSSSQAVSGSLTGSDIYSVEIGGYWSATERFSFGPSFRYSREDSSNIGTRDAWALAMQTQYRLGEKLKFMASLGMETDTYSQQGGSSSVKLTGGLIASYAITEKLQWRNSVTYVTVPSPSEKNYSIDNLRITSALSRELLKANISAGVNVNFAKFVQVGTVGTNLGNQDNLSVFLTYSRKLFMDRMDFDTTLRYSTNSGDKDWSQWQLSVGVFYSF